MATTESRTKSTGGQKYVDFDEFIDYQVRKTRAGIRSTDLLTSLVVLALAVTTYLLAFVVIDHWVTAGGIGYWPRLVSLTLLVLFVVGWTAWKLVFPYLRQVNALFAAREIEHAQPDLKSSLLTLVDLKQAGRAVPPHIVAAMEKRAARKLSATDVEQAVDRRLLLRLSYALLAVVAVMCLYTVFSPKSISNSVLRALLPSSSRSVSTRTRIEAVDPGDAEVLARSQLEVTVDLAGEIPETATLLYSSEDRSFVDEPITLRDTGEGLHRFRGVLAGPNGRGLLQNLTYRIVAGDAESRDYQVTVQQAPYATVTEVLLDYPDYMRLDDKTQPGGDIDAWEGTVVTLRAETNMPVASGTIERSTAEDASLGTDSLPMTLIDDTHLEVTWRLEFDEGVPYRFYRIDVRTESGAGDPRPRFYSVNIRRDIPPEVRIVHPSGDVELPANGTLPVAYEAMDPDFMLRYVRMLFEQPGEDPGKFSHRTRRLYEAPPERASTKGIADVRLSEFDLKPGDVISLWLEAKDNQAPLGAEDGNLTRTSRINVKILDPVSPEEAQQQLDEQRDELQQELQESQQQDGEAGGDQMSEATGDQEGDGEGMTEEGGETSEGETGENGEETTGRGQTQGDEGTTQQRSEGTEGNEQTQDTEAGAETGEEAGEGSETGTEGEQPGAEPSADGEQTGEGSEASESGEADENEALRKLIDEYNALEEAQREREQQQQQQRDGAQDSQEGEPDQTGEQPQSEGADGQGGESPSPESAESQTSSGGANQPSGDEAGTEQSPSESETTREGAGGDQTPADDSDAEARSGDVENGREGMPTDDEGSAQQQRATGDEEGPARPETDPNADPTPAQEPIEREGGDPATRPTEQPSDDAAQGMPQNTGGGEQPEGAQTPPDNPGQQSESPGDAGSSQSGMPESDRPPARTGEQPSGPDQSDPEEGARDGQRSEQPASGEQGTGQQSSEGTQGGTQQGPGDATSSPGSQSDAAGQSGGQPGDQAGEGSTSQPGGNQPGGEGTSNQSGEGGGGESGQESTNEGGGESGQQGANEGSGNESGSQEGAGEGGEGGEVGGEGAQGGGEGSESGEGGGGGGESGEEGGGGGGGGESSESQASEGGSAQGGGTASRSGGGGGGGSGAQAPNGSGGGADSGADSGPLDPNLEDKRRASELVLERLKDQLERGEAPDDLLKDLGWTEDKLRDFMGRLEQRLSDTGEDTSPEAQARRRQFETILEGIDYASEGQERDAGEGPRESAQGFGSQRRRVPPEFQDQQNEYRRRLSRQTRGN